MQLSLHALSGANSPRVMRLKGICGNKPLFILIDLGSTHDFTTRLGCLEGGGRNKGESG